MKRFISVYLVFILLALPAGARRWIPKIPAPVGGIAFVAGASAGTTNTNTAVTSGVSTAGATFLIVMATSLQNPTITDSKGNTYTALTTTVATSTLRGRLFYCASPVVGSGHTFTATTSGGYPTISVASFSGITATFDVENGAFVTPAATTIQPGSVTPGFNNSLVITGLAIDTAVSATASIDSSFSIGSQISPVVGTSFGSAIAYKIQTTATAENPTWTISSASSSVARIASFKP